MTARRTRFTDDHVAKLKPKKARYAKPDPELIGHYVRVYPTGALSYWAVARDRASAKQVWTKIGEASRADAGWMSIEQAREQAREVIKRVKEGKPAIEAPPPAPETVAAVAENWLSRDVQKRGLITAKEIERSTRKYVLPRWGDRVFTDIKRSDVSKMLDEVEDQHGPSMADSVLGHVRAMMHWYEGRSDSYTVPLARNMRRAGNVKRDRILTDAEIKLIWDTANEAGAFGGVVQLALLTAQRKAKLLGARWSDIKDGVWRIPRAEREKGVPTELVLPELALEVLRRQPRFSGDDRVFPPSRGGKKVMGTSQPLKDLNIALALAVPNWGLHDLRRTWRTLASRCGVPREHGERVLGHRIGSAVEGIYDHHRYVAEMKIALAKVAAHITGIVHGAPAKVVPIRQPRRRGRS
jgi:integrase